MDSLRAKGPERPGGPSDRLRHHAALWLSLVVLSGLTLVILGTAFESWNRTVSGFFCDPFGNVSAFGWPAWSGYQQATQDDRVVAVEGEELEALSEPGYPARRLDALAERLRAAHKGRMRVTLLRDTVRRDVELPLHPVGLLPFTVLCLGYILTAWLWLSAAGVAYLLRPQGRGTRAFVSVAGLVALTLLCAYEVNTTRHLTGLFLTAYALLPGALLRMGLLFPDHNDPRWAPRWLLAATQALGLALLGLVLLLWHKGEPFLPYLSQAVGASLLLMLALLGLRLYRARGALRVHLWVTMLALMPVCASVGGVLLTRLPYLSPTLFLLLPPVTVLTAFGLLVALLRLDFWEGITPMPRRLLRQVLMLLLGVLWGLGAALSCALSLSGAVPGWVGLTVPPLLVALALPGVRKLEDWISAALLAGGGQGPTVEQLSVWLSNVTSGPAIAASAESAARRFVGCARVRFVVLPVPIYSDDSLDLSRSAQLQGLLASSLLGPSSLVDSFSESPELRIARRAARNAGVDGLHMADLAEIFSGKEVWLERRSGRWARLLVPARFREQLVGFFAVGDMPRGRLFSTEDVTLLRLLSGEAALAVACVSAREQVEALRQAQQTAFRREKEAVLGTVAAEIAHEIRTPINFLRTLLERCTQWLQQGVTPESQDVESGRDELERLERMAQNLRRMATAGTLQRAPVNLLSLCEHVRLLLQDRLTGRSLDLEVDTAAEVDGDRDALVQIMVNLVGNGLDACPSPRRVGVSCFEHEGRLRITVWDEGPGFTQEVGRLFQPWFTTKRNGTGLGLPITRRLVRAHGWEIGAQRRAGLTCFDVLIPAEEWRRRPPDENNFESNPLH